MKKTFIILSVLLTSLMATTGFSQIIVQGLNPAGAQGFYGFTNPDWGADLSIPANSATGLGVIVDDGTAGDSLGCNALVNGAAVTGKIAFIYRGTCEFGTKALKAQNAGAIAAVIINNVPGTMTMGAGAEGGSVTIPVVMISQETGALLRPYLNAGTLQMFIGSKFGLFANDLGITAKDVIRPLNFATPSLLAQDTSEFVVKVGANVRNFGNQTQNATLTATITLNGATQVYSETATVASLASGDSTFITLDDFHLNDANVARYTLTYTVTSGAADEESSDNVIAQDFLITDGAYSKSRFDVATGNPIRTTGLTSANGPKITWGILLDAVKGSRVKVNGIKFAASTTAPAVLTGELVTGYLYEWTDASGDGGISDDELVELAVGFYTYTADLQNEYITIPLSDEPGFGPQLADDKIYYIAVQYAGSGTSFFFPVDEALDYNETINAFSQSINPLFDVVDDAWYGGGFGSEYTLAISAITAFNNVSVTENELNLKLNVFPNPASDVVNITFGNAVSNSDIQVDVIDVAGRSVMNQQYNITNAQNFVSVNTTNLSNGTYFFKVSMNGQVVKSLPVVVSK